MTMQASGFFTREEKEQLKQCIRDAEMNTSGEIRIHVETFFTGEVLDRAATVFARLNMHKTELRNGVLLYLAVVNKKYAVLGDVGINSVVPGDFWNEVKGVMEEHFRNSRFSQGLCLAVAMVGEHLKKHFPRHNHDINELTDEISFDKVD